MLSVDQDRFAHLTAEECHAVLQEENELDVLRALVAAQALLHEMRENSVSGTLEVHVQFGIARSVRYPKQHKIC